MWKFTILKSKLSHLSYIAVEYFPFTIAICVSKYIYDSDVDDSDVFLSLSSTGYMSSIAEWNDALFSLFLLHRVVYNVCGVHPAHYH